MNTTKVLCVENQPEHQDVLKYMLEGAGYEVLCAATGAQALIDFARQDLQGVLLEYDLPDVTGSALRAEMKRIKPEVPILLFSGIGSQTPFLIRFFDSYLRNAKTAEWSIQDLDS